ncbi:MAG: D-alanine--D-alanine ligase [Pseudomonadales bacterium]
MPEPDIRQLDGPIAVLMGGTASEREVSLRSGAAVLEVLQHGGYNCIGIDTAIDLVATLHAAGPAFAFIAVHGSGGEDGRLQALLELCGIPYSGSGVLASALAMDKLRSKQLWRGIGLATPDFMLYSEIQASRDVTYFDTALQTLGGRIFVKPVAEGSSFGMSVADSVAGLRSACELAAGFGQPVLLERAIAGDEYTVAILRGQCLPSIRIETGRSFYDFDAKYVDEDTRFVIPSGLSAQDEAALGALSLAAFDALGCAGWGRVDVMRCAASNTFYLLEVNTVPGLTDHSLVPKAARAAGYSFDELIESIVRAGLQPGEVPR